MRVPSIVVLFGTWAAIGAETLPLDAALVRLEKGNHSLEAARARIGTAEENHKASVGNFLPVVKLQASAMHLDRDIVMDLDPIRTAILQIQSGDATQLQNLSTTMKTGTPLTTAQQNAYQQGYYQNMDANLPHFLDTMSQQNDWGVELVAYQPLFHGGRIFAGERVASARQRAAGAELEKQNGDLRRDFIKYYVQGALLRQSIILRTQALETIQRHRDQARKAVDAGLADRAALLRAELAISEARTSLSDDSSKLQSVSITLAQMSGGSEPVLPSDTLAGPPAMPGTADSLQRSVAERNPLLKSLSAQQEVAHRAVSAKNADFLPEVGLFGKYEFNREAARAALQPIWVVGIKGEITLFHGGGDYHQRAAALSTEREVAALQGEASGALEAQTKRQILTLRQARTRWENLAAQADLARESHRVAQSRFAQGQATGLEVVDAWLSQEKAELERLSAAGDGWIALAEILWATGRTDEFSGLWTGARK
jgi:outer membrane protein TolC